MGQNSSRAQPSSSSIPNPPAPQLASDPIVVAEPRPEPLLAEVAADAPRRSSKRRSILNLVKSSRRRLSSTTSSTSETTRKSWRNSMRWSKPVHDSAPASELFSESVTEGASTGSASTLPVTEKGKEREQQAAVPEADPEIVPERPLTPFPSTLSESISEPSGHVHETSQNIGSWLSGHSSITDALSQGGGGGGDGDEIWPGRFSTPEPEVAEPLDEVPVMSNEPYHDRSAPAPEAEPLHHHPFAPPPARQFPPPGAFVVVQGIVHTIDDPRSQPPTPAAPSTTLPADNDTTSSNPIARSGITRRASSMPRPSVPATGIEHSGSRARDRLSALLRSRPSSIVSSHTPFLPSPDDNDTNSAPSHHLPSLNPDSEPQSTELSSASDSDSNTAATGFTTPNVEADFPQETSDDPSIAHEAPATAQLPRPPAVSSNSIDVLGTLLSVAAAATAASLLTGSSEPILSSGLEHTAAQPPPPTARPMSPTPTAGMDMFANGRADRMRQVWTNIRERLGLRSGPGDPASGADRGPRGVQDTREMMLQEMARAFNIGFGLGNGAEGTVPGGNAEETADAYLPAPPPPEGSFERFLVDLQSDLRISLRPEEDTSTASTDEVTVPAERSTLEEGVTNTDDAAEPFPAERGGESEEAAQGDHSEEPEARVEIVATESVEDAIDVENDDDGMPPLQELSDSDDSDDEEDEHDSNDFGFAGTSQATGQHDATPGTTAGGSSRIDASGRINWWRVYRFPAINSPGPADAVQDMNTHSPFGYNPSTTSVPSSTSTPPSFSSMPFNDNTGETTPHPQSFSVPSATHPEPASNNTFIPVIVVGLQSVNVNWQADAPPEAANDPMGLFGHHPDAPAAEDEMDAFANQNVQTRGRGVGRGWQSRAANAIRNLRPGRRAVSRGAAQFPGTGPGSRTFMIYVIGGYYPPDHSIVTGGPTSFESFEALLDLAEMFGQTKTPTATKEEIDNSGLEIIKLVQLEHHEKDGRVASNCTERCLICLDEYDAEDEIRVMNCRHAFHRTCVDKWLQTGRNNCPACRTKGVSTAAPPSHMSSAAEA